MKAGLDMSKCERGGLHHPPLSEDSAQLGGQILVAVTVVETTLEKHALDWTHLIS